MYPDLSSCSTDDGHEFGDLSIAVVIPCLDEEATIAEVVDGFRKALPAARIYVYDNASSDNTMQVAKEAGATVRCEPARGKGNVVRRMFSDIDADIFVLVDGDGTYPADCAPRMIAALIENQMDMVSGARIAEEAAAYRPGHRFGNSFITSMVSLFFGQRFPTSSPATGFSPADSSSPSPRFRKDSKSRPSSRCTRSKCVCPSPRNESPTSRGPRARPAS